MPEKLLPEFPPVSDSQWEEAIRRDLKGADFDRKLLWETGEGITVRPYYRSSDIEALPQWSRSVPTRESNEWEIRESPEDTPAVEEPWYIRGHRWRECGATIVQELAFSLAEAVEYLAAAGDVEEAASKTAFSVGIGSHFFLEIAKLRALRLLWSRVVESFGVSPAAVPITVHARTLGYNQTIYAAHVNLLRSATEAMSAIVGGCDSLYVLPFDAPYRTPGDFSRRLARNTQAILKWEAGFDRVGDPAAGSYYVEALTQSMASAAWRLFQDVEASGGFRQASSWIEQQVADARQQNESALSFRRTTLVGTNNYPDPDERMLPEIERVVEGRLAEPFEQIRLRTERSGNTPRFLLAEMGDPKMRRVRSAFAANLLGCAGFGVDAAYFADAAAAAKAGESYSAIVLCSSDAEYETLAPALLATLDRPIPVLIAGAPSSEEQLKATGIAGFLHRKMNAAQVLAEWQRIFGIHEQGIHEQV